MSFLEFGALVKNLPSESALRTAQRNELSDEELAEIAAKNSDAPHGSWSHESMLTAAVFDAIQMLIHVQLSRGGVRTDPPTPMRRPGVVGSSAPATAVNPQMRAYLEAARTKHAEMRAALMAAPTDNEGDTSE